VSEKIAAASLAELLKPVKRFVFGVLRPQAPVPVSLLKETGERNWPAGLCCLAITSVVRLGCGTRGLGVALWASLTTQTILAAPSDGAGSLPPGSLSLLDRLAGE